MLTSILQAGYLYYFSDGHAIDYLTSFFDHTQINNLVNIIDWKAVWARYWGGSGNLDVKRKKQAEFLVGCDIDPRCISGFGCYNEMIKNHLVGIGVPGSMVAVAPDAYF
jgi:hypothetical protein